MNISVPAALKKWIDRRVADGAFGTSSEFVRHVLREAWLREQGGDAALEAELLKGLDSPAAQLTEHDWQALSRRASAPTGAPRPRRRKP